MDYESQRRLQILQEVSQNGHLTQRDLSNKLGIALGLTNSYIKRCAKKGYIKVTTIPRNRVKYLLTPQGIAEKARLTYEFMQYSLDFYKKTRELIDDTFIELEEKGIKDVVFYGADVVGEIAYLSLKGMSFHLVTVFDDAKNGETFMGYPVQSPEKIADYQWDKVVVTSFRSKDIIKKRLLELGVSSDKIILF